LATAAAQRVQVGGERVPVDLPPLALDPDREADAGRDAAGPADLADLEVDVEEVRAFGDLFVPRAQLCEALAADHRDDAADLPHVAQLGDRHQVAMAVVAVTRDRRE